MQELLTFTFHKTADLHTGPAGYDFRNQLLVDGFLNKGILLLFVGLFANQLLQMRYRRILQLGGILITCFILCLLQIQLCLLQTNLGILAFLQLCLFILPLCIQGVLFRLQLCKLCTNILQTLLRLFIFLFL